MMTAARRLAKDVRLMRLRCRTCEEITPKVSIPPIRLFLLLRVALPILVAQKFDDFPDLIRFQLISEGCHDRSWSPLVDRVEDHRIGRLINPFVVGQVGAYRAFGLMSVARIAPGL